MIMASNLKLPPNQAQILILGWPKTGSSSIFQWLSDHPQVFGSKIEESFLFIDQNNPYFNRRGASIQNDGIEKFYELFKGSNLNQIWLEGTTHSVFQDYMINFVSNNIELTDAIMIIRDPVSRIFSSFTSSQNNFSNISKKLSWSKYVDCILNNKMGSLKKYYSDTFSYESSKNQLISSDYAFWIKKWKKNVSEKKLHFILFEDIQSNPKKTIKHLASSIGLDESFYNDYIFNKKNTTLNIKYPLLHKSALKLRPLIGNSSLIDKIKRLYLKQNTISKKEDLNSKENFEASKRLKEYFKPSIMELSSLLNRDLSSWINY